MRNRHTQSLQNKSKRKEKQAAEIKQDVVTIVALACLALLLAL